MIDGMTRKGILRSVGDGAFRDEGQAENCSSLARFALFFGEAVLGNEGCQCQPQRRCHACGHHSSHRGKGFTGQKAYGESVGSLVDRSAHVKGHHGTQNKAEQHRVGLSHALQHCRQAFVDVANGFADHIDHQQADNGG